MYETTNFPSQKGVAALQSGMPLHCALSPSTQRLKCAQQPTAPHPHVPGSTNTEWQSVRVSHASSVVTIAHGTWQAIAGQSAGGASGGTH